MEVIGFFLISVLFAFLGHALYCFYRWLLLAALALIGWRPTKVAVASDGPAEDAPETIGRLLSRWRIREQSGTILGILGALLAAGAFIWLLGDLVSDTSLRRWIQLLAMATLTVTIGAAGYRLRRKGPDPLGTALMVLGWLLIVPDAVFYQTYIAKHDLHLAWFGGMLMGVLGLLAAVRTTSRTFAWLGPLALLFGLLALPDRFDLGSDAVSFVASLAGPLFLVAALWLEQSPLGALLARPFLSTACLSTLVALSAYTDCRPEAVPTLHLEVLILGGGTLACAMYRLTDLRGLAVLLFYDAFLFVHYYQHFGTTSGSLGTILAAIALVLLAIERQRRVGPERRRGLDPMLSVPAVMLLIAALAMDGLSAGMLIDRVTSLRGIGPTAGSWFSVTELTRSWAEAQRAVFYLARIDPTLRAAAVSGTLVTAGLTYVALAALIPFYAYGAGFALAGAGVWTLLAARPFELYGTDYAYWLTAMAAFAAAGALILSRSRASLATPVLGLPSHAWLPATWLALGYSTFHPDAVPGWFYSLTLAVIGVQASIHGRLFVDSIVCDALGRLALVMAWPMAIGSLSYGPNDQVTMAPLLLGALTIQIAILWWGMARHEVPSLVAGASGLVITLLVTIDHVRAGAVLTKMVVIVVGVALLWLGTRSRRSAAAAAAATALCILGLVPGALAQSDRMQTPETIRRLSAANPYDPIIAVRLRAAKLAPDRQAAQTHLWGTFQSELAHLGAISSIDAALQMATSPLRIRVSTRSQADSPVSQIARASERFLDYHAMAHRLSGSPDLPAPRTDDPLLHGPADRITLRFKDAATLGKILDSYENIGRALLAVTDPGMAVPSPRRAFQEMLGMDLVESAKVAGDGEGALLIGDPFLGMAPDIVLAVAMRDAPAASAQAAVWASRAGADRVASTGKVSLLGTTAQGVALVRTAMDDTAQLSGEGVPHLDEAPDFRYAALLALPQPDAFLFIGESAIARLISPPFWIAARRREDCLAHQADLEAAIAFGTLTGNPLPATPELAEAEAVARGWIESGCQCRSGGSLQWAGPGKMTCSIHGGRLSPRPLAGTMPSWAYGEEVFEYQRFTSRYRALYYRWIDPVAIGVTLADHAVTLDTVVLPLARLPEYNALSGAVRRDRRPLAGPMEAPPGSDGALAAVAVRLPEWTGIVDLDANVSRYGGPTYLQIGGVYMPVEPSVWHMFELLRAAKPGPTVGAVLVPGDLSLLSLPSVTGTLSGVPLPLVLAQQVESADGAQSYLEDLLAGQDPFSVGEARGWGARLRGRRRVYGAADSHWMALATGREILERALSEPPRTGTLPGAHAWMLIHPDRVATAPGVLAFAGDALADRCRKTMASMQALVDLKASWPPPAGTLPEGDPFVNVAARCPGGGTYTLDHGWVRCSVHGTLAAPTSSPPAAGSPLALFLGGLDRIEVELALLADGVRARLSWREREINGGLPICAQRIQPSPR